MTDALIKGQRNTFSNAMQNISILTLNKTHLKGLDDISPAVHELVAQGTKDVWLFQHEFWYPYTMRNVASARQSQQVTLRTQNRFSSRNPLFEAAFGCRRGKIPSLNCKCSSQWLCISSRLKQSSCCSAENTHGEQAIHLSMQVLVG